MCVCLFMSVFVCVQSEKEEVVVTDPTKFGKDENVQEYNADVAYPQDQVTDVSIPLISTNWHIINYYYYYCSYTYYNSLVTPRSCR